MASKIIHGINIQEFDARTRVTALARDLFYEAKDAGQMVNLPREFRALPLHVQQYYFSLAKEMEQAGTIHRPAPSWWTKLRATVRRLVVSS